MPISKNQCAKDLLTVKTYNQVKERKKGCLKSLKFTVAVTLNSFQGLT